MRLAFRRTPEGPPRRKSARPSSLAAFLKFYFFCRSDLTGVFQRFDALGGEFLAVLPHAKCQQFASEPVLITVLPIIIRAVLFFPLGDGVCCLSVGDSGECPSQSGSDY